MTYFVTVVRHKHNYLILKLKSLWKMKVLNQGPMQAVVPLESVISTLMHLYAFFLESLLRLQKEMILLSKSTVQYVPTNFNRKGKEKPYLTT